MKKMLTDYLGVGRTQTRQKKMLAAEAAILSAIYTSIDLFREQFGGSAVLRLNLFNSPGADILVSLAAGFTVTFIVLYVMDHSLFEGLRKIGNKRKTQST